MKNLCAIALILGGVAGIVLPIIPGIPMIAAGAAMLGRDHPLIRPCRTWLQSKGILKP